MVDLIIADDHSVLRQALCEMLESRGDFNIIAQADNGKELLKLLEDTAADVVIMDVSMPELDGVSALEQMTKTDVPPVLILSADEGEKNIRAALNAGAAGFIPKNAKLDELKFAIASILEGKTYLSPSVTSTLVNSTKKGSGDTTVISQLTARETEILTLLADGHPNRIIGKMLHISTRTVDTHRSNILRKLKVKTNAQLVKIAIANELVSI